MTLRALLAAVFVAAVAVGFALPAPPDSAASPHSRVDSLTPGRG